MDPLKCTIKCNCKNQKFFFFFMLLFFFPLSSPAAAAVYLKSPAVFLAERLRNLKC